MAADVLTLIPEIAAIDIEDLQGYCNDWIKRPIACHWGIIQVNVTPDLRLEILLDESRFEAVGDKAFVPIDELVGFIIDQHFADPSERRHLHTQVRELKQQLNEEGHAFEATVAKVGTLYVKCRNPACDALMETSQRAVDGQRVSMPATELTCPGCGHSNTYDGHDLRLIFKD